jgi:hypothetical protein
VGEGVLVGAVGGTTVGVGACVGGFVVGVVAGVVGETVDNPPGCEFVVVGSWLGAEVVGRGVGARVAGVRTTWVLRGGGVAAGAGRTQ